MSEAWVEDYRRDGYYGPIRVMDEKDAKLWRAEAEGLERDYPNGYGGRPIQQFMRVNGHIVLPFLSKIAALKTILTPVSQILGPNLLLWSAEFFIKEAGTTKIVSWHQDLTYWGMGETDDEVTAWVALSDVSIEAGCMRFIPGSHKLAIQPHNDTFADDNLLSRGQELAGVDEGKAVHCPLKPGEVSLHHGRTFHASGANASNDRRIGVAIRYVTPEVREGLDSPDYAILMQGEDKIGGWTHIPPPEANFAPQAMARYERILAERSKTMLAGAEGQKSAYRPAGAPPAP